MRSFGGGSVRRELSSFLLVGALLLALVSCGADSEPSQSASPSVEPSAAPCIDEAELLQHRDASTKHLLDSVKELRNLDFSAAVTDLRLAASESRAMADEAADVSDETSAHLLRAADALDQAGDSLGDRDVDGATSWMSQATNEIEQAVASISLDDYC
jgi:hypothetical protein